MTRASTFLGDVEGRIRNDVHLFASIPYASPPIGQLRFAPPQPHPGWEGVLDVTRFGPASPQHPGRMTANQEVLWDEDSLTLNVSTPAPDNAHRPVLVWIHGGGYTTGQGNIPWYSGESFATKGDVVTVSINYRLGALGFADLSRFGAEFATSGTNGLQDMVLALEWVRDNIAAFGGDPTQVTIAGESAGAFAVSTLLTMPSAAGLFHRAIAQSGAGHHTMSPDQSDQITTMLLTELGVSTSEELRQLEARSVLDAQGTINAKVTSQTSADDNLQLITQAFYPTHGNEALPEAPIVAAAKGIGATVPLLTGSNLHETTMFHPGPWSEDTVAALAAGYANDPNVLTDAYRREGHKDIADIGIAMTTDWTFRIPAVRLAEARESAGAETWMYLFSWESRHKSLRATHALEVPFTFNTLSSRGVDLFIGPGEIPQHVADVMHAAWTSFIRTGMPEVSSVPQWPVYRSSDRKVVEFNNETTLRTDPQPITRKAWTNVR